MEGAHAPLFCVAGVAQSHIHGCFAWQAWHNLTSALVMAGLAQSHICFFLRTGRATHGARLGLFGRRRSRGILCGNPGTISHAPSFSMVGVAQSHIRLCFCVAGVGLIGLGGARGPVGLRMTPQLFFADSYIHRRFAWQAWRLPVTGLAGRWCPILSAIWIDYDRQRKETAKYELFEGSGMGGIFKT